MPILDVTFRLLDAQAATFPTPVKTPRPAKYQYSTPGKPTKEQDGKPTNAKKRVKLFSSSNPSEVEDDAKFGMKKISEENHQTEHLEKRLTSRSQSTVSNSTQSKGHHEIARQWTTKNQSRRTKATKSPSETTLNLGDFLVSSDKQKKQTKKKKKVKNGTSTDTEPMSDKPLNLTVDSDPHQAKSNEAALAERPNVVANVTNADSTERFSAVSQGFEYHGVWSKIAQSMNKAEPQEKDKVSTVVEKKLKQMEKLKFVAPDPSLVTHKVRLDKVVQLYCFCLDQNLMVNVTAELYLLIELLCIRCSETKLPVSNCYFDSVHNCVYFACQVLQRQTDILFSLCHKTLGNLSRIKRLELFAPDLKEQLENRCKRTVQGGEMQEKETSDHLDSVPFLAEKDNVDNFPSERGFQDFKKQRDTFYEIFRAWKTDARHRRSPDPPGGLKAPEGRMWDQSDNLQLTTAIAKLLNISRSPTNMLHLARLFSSQLLKTFLSTSRDVDRSAAADKAFSKTDPLTLSFLEKRFRGSPTGSSVERLVEESAGGSMKFFHDFISHCHNQKFLHFLRLVLTETIIEKEREMADYLGADNTEHGKTRCLSG